MHVLRRRTYKRSRWQSIKKKAGMAVASEKRIQAAINRHVGRELGVCDCEGLKCGDCLCGVTSSLCISGLLMQLSAEGGNVDERRAGSCGEKCYISACYPCVITDGCLCQWCASFVASQADSNFASDATLVLIRGTVRKKLIDRAAGGTADWIAPLLQQWCGIFCCVPCHDAALVREIRPEGYGSLWCAASDESSSPEGEQLVGF